MNQYGPELQIAGNQQFLAHKLAVLEHAITEIQRKVQMGGPPPPLFSVLPNSTGQPASRFDLGRQERQILFNIQRPVFVQPTPRRVRNANRNLNPCYACQSRKKKCNRVEKSPNNICERCLERGLKECHPAPRPLTEGHATEEHNMDKTNYYMFAHSEQGPTSVSSTADLPRRGGNVNHMDHDGTGNMRGLSCAATYNRIKKENADWDKGMLIPPA